MHQLRKCGPRGNPGRVVAVEEAVTVTVAALLVKVPTEQVTPARELDALQVNVGVAAKLLIGVSVRLELPLEPGLMVKLLGEALSEKSEAMVAKVEMLDHVPSSPPDGARACTSQ